MITSTLSYEFFVFFSMFDVGGQREERRKWIQCFNGEICMLTLQLSLLYNVRSWIMSCLDPYC